MTSRKSVVVVAAITVALVIALYYALYGRRKRRSPAKTAISLLSPEFQRACEQAKSISGASDETLLRLYGLFKRTTWDDEGLQARATAPPWEPTARAKWMACNRAFEDFDTKEKGTGFQSEAQVPRRADSNRFYQLPKLILI